MPEGKQLLFSALLVILSLRSFNPLVVGYLRVWAGWSRNIRKPGMIRLNGADPQKIADEFRNGGWRVFVFPKGIFDKKTFFDAVKVHFPLEPPIIGNRSWDALSDSLWGGLDGLQEKKIAIVWPVFCTSGEHELETAIKILEDLSISLGDSEATDGNPKQVAVIIT